MSLIYVRTTLADGYRPETTGQRLQTLDGSQRVTKVVRRITSQGLRDPRGRLLADCQLRDDIFPI